MQHLELSDNSPKEKLLRVLGHTSGEDSYLHLNTAETIPANQAWFAQEYPGFSSNITVLENSVPIQVIS